MATAQTRRRRPFSRRPNDSNLAALAQREERVLAAGRFEVLEARRANMLPQSRHASRGLQCVPGLDRVATNVELSARHP